jgi:hypothetical protein
VPHLLDLLEERLHRREERSEAGAVTEALLVILERAPLDSDDVVVRLLDAVRDLVGETLRCLRQDRLRLSPCGFELVVALVRDSIADVLDDHGSSSLRDRYLNFKTMLLNLKIPVEWWPTI